MKKKTQKINKDKLLIIIPAFNEAGNIKETVSKVINKGFKYLVVDDCSYDATDFICKENNFNYISNSKNLGLSKTFREGIKYAIENGYEYVVQFDGDGQHEITTVEEMLTKIKDYDIILGNRFRKDFKNKDNRKEIAWKILRWVIKLNCKTNISDPTCGLRMFNKKFMQYYLIDKKMEVEPSSISFAIKKLKFKCCEIETTIHERREGESHFSSKYKIFKYMTKQIIKLLFINNFWIVKRSYKKSQKQLRKQKSY